MYKFLWTYLIRPLLIAMEALMPPVTAVHAAAATKAIITDRRTGMQKDYPVADNVIIYHNTMVCLNAAGYAIPAADAVTNMPVVGVADETVDNRSTVVGHANGFVHIRVVSGQVYYFAATSITQSMLGDTMYAVDDSTIDDTAGSTNKIPAGVLVEYVSATSGGIYIPVAGYAFDVPDKSITLADARVFISTVQTGTGASQNVAHGLGVIPTGILVVPVDLSPATVGLFTVVEGAHTSTNVVVTVTTSKTFKVFAWA